MNQKNGYTLVEILVVISVLGFLFATGFANYREFSRRQVLSNASKKIQGDIRLAQSMAFQGRIPSSANCMAPNYLHGYNFTILSSNHYEIRAACSGGNATSAEADVYLPTGVSIASPFPVPNPILFKVLGEGTNIEPAGTSIILSQSGTSSTVTISISGAGKIQ